MVGIILVTYNRSDVTNLALDSLVRARHERSRFKVFVVDNNSRVGEFERIERFISYLRSQQKLDITWIRNRENLGYAAGNNLGIKRALADAEITHLCLLNNDVIVSDGWLDRLVEQSAGALVGPVSNSVGNEQIVATSYAKHDKNGYTTRAVQAFATTWAAAHRKNVVESRMLGFFCVLGERRLFTTVGLLDERFGLGFFEDDDYCLRCHSAGFALRIVREAFVHHFGSASFSRLPAAETNGLFARNRQLFEEKHGVKWQAPSIGGWQKSLVQELAWLAAQGVDEARRVAILDEWLRQFRDHKSPSLIEKLKTDCAARLAGLHPRLPQAISQLSGLASVFAHKARYGVRHPLRAAHRLRDIVHAQLGRPDEPPSLQTPRFGSRGTILIGPIQGLNGRRQRPQHLAEGLVRAGFDVFWIEPKPSPRLYLSPQPSGITLIEVPGIDFSSFYTTGITPCEAQDLTALLRRRLFGAARLETTFLLLQSPFWAELGRQFSGRVVYDCMDHHAGFASATLEVEMLETQLLRDANRVAVSSDDLFARLCARDSALRARLHILRNGCSPNDFRRQKAPRASVVGYFGAIAEWFDHELVIGAARLLPEVRFDIIGDSLYSPIAKLALPPNLRLLGEQPYEKLSQLTADWRAALIPFRLSELVVATNPVKLYEYSALGLPIVATPIPEVTRADIEVFIGKTSEEFAQQIRTAMASDSAEKIAQRRRFAEANSWSARVNILTRLFESS